MEPLYLSPNALLTTWLVDAFKTAAISSALDRAKANWHEYVPSSFSNHAYSAAQTIFWLASPVPIIWV